MYQLIWANFNFCWIAQNTKDHIHPSAKCIYKITNLNLTKNINDCLRFYNVLSWILAIICDSSLLCLLCLEPSVWSVTIWLFLCFWIPPNYPVHGPRWLPFLMVQILTEALFAISKFILKSFLILEVILLCWNLTCYEPANYKCSLSNLH